MVIRPGLPVVIGHPPLDRAGRQPRQPGRVFSVDPRDVDAAPRYGIPPRELEGPRGSGLHQAVGLFLALETQRACDFVVEIQRERVAAGKRDKHQTTHLDDRIFAGQGAAHDMVALLWQVEFGFMGDTGFAHFNGYDNPGRFGRQ